MPASLIILILACLAFGIWLPWFIRQNNKRRRAEMDALQARRKWIIEDKDLPTIGTGTIRFRVHSPDDNWEVQSVVFRSAQTHDTTGTVVEFSQPWAGADPGMFVIGPAIPPKEMALFGSMMGGLIVQMVAKVAGLPAGEMARLEVQKTDAPVTPMATPEAVNWVDVPQFASVVKAWTEHYKGEKLHPVLLLGNGKLRVRVRGNFSKPADIEAFITMALTAGKSVSL
jgi:hypothetical protein